MKHLILNRYFQNDELTLGFLKIQGMERPYFYTLENPWLENKQFVSCIPDGTYLLKPHSGTQFRDVYKLYELDGSEVMGRSDVLTHWGSFVKNTKGCILIGEYQCDLIDRDDGITKMAIANTKQSCNRLHNLLGNETHKITIIGGTTNWRN